MPKHRELPNTPLAAAFLKSGKRLIQVATEVGLNYKSLFAYVHGDRNPKRPVKRLLAEYFGTTVGALFPEEGEHEKRGAA